MVKLFLSAFFTLGVVILFGQLPKTDVYLAQYKNLANKPQLLSVKFLNAFNRNGYNNQAKFFSGDDIYLTVGLDTSQNTDIYHLSLKKNEIYRFTATEKISEFSPSLAPDINFMSVVRIEADGKDQSLWNYPTNRSGIGKRVLPVLKNIGYFHWLGRDSVALFLVGSPNTLAIANVKTGKTEVITENAGRCLKTSPEGNLLFVQKIRPDYWLLKSYHFQDKAINTICQMPSGKEDFEVVANGTIITGDGPFIKTILPQKESNWTTISDFTSLGIRNIQRLSVNGDRILFINNK
jgi:hypothetical protein